jgi:hypothetical protein
MQWNVVLPESRRVSLLADLHLLRETLLYGISFATSILYVFLVSNAEACRFPSTKNIVWFIFLITLYQKLSVDFIAPSPESFVLIKTTAFWKLSLFQSLGHRWEENILITPMIAGVNSPETSNSVYPAERCSIPKGSHLRTHRRENLKSYQTVY